MFLIKIIFRKATYLIKSYTKEPVRNVFPEKNKVCFYLFFPQENGGRNKIKRSLAPIKEMSTKIIAAVMQPVSGSVFQGGAFYFLEHVVSDPSTWTYFFQHVLERLWYYLMDGCRITRATWADLEEAGFSQIHLRHVEAPEVTVLIRPHIMGYAVK